MKTPVDAGDDNSAYRRVHSTFPSSSYTLLWLRTAPYILRSSHCIRTNIASDHLSQ